MKWLRRLAIGLVVLILLVGGLAIETAYVAGVFKTIRPHFAGRCRSVAGVVGAEDAIFAPDGAHVFLSADDRRSALAGHPAPGHIWLYEVGGGAPVDLTPQATSEFHPHGIGFWPTPEGGRLFVISHPDEGRLPPGEGRQVVEIYDWNGEGLVHQATYDDPLIRNPNAVAPTGPDSFYVSNDHGPPGVPRVIEEFLRLPRANVVYFDGKTGRIAADGVRLANGLDLSADGRHLYLASTTGGAILFFDRDPATNVLSGRQEVALDSGPDNVRRASDGTLWIGAHPQLLKVMGNVQNPDNLSPSQVLRLTPGADGSATSARVDEIYLGDGHELSAASVGVVNGKHLIIGPVADAKFLDCTME
jgi:arylesterase / paraoxonase